MTKQNDVAATKRRGPRLPVLRTPDGEVKTIEQWQEFARRDDCLNRMVPSDLRAILSNFE